MIQSVTMLINDTEHYDAKKRLKVVMASVDMLSAVMQNVITTHVRVLNVVAPLNTHGKLPRARIQFFASRICI